MVGFDCAMAGAATATAPVTAASTAFVRKERRRGKMDLGVKSVGVRTQSLIVSFLTRAGVAAPARPPATRLPPAARRNRPHTQYRDQAWNEANGAPGVGHHKKPHDPVGKPRGSGGNFPCDGRTNYKKSTVQYKVHRGRSGFDVGHETAQG